jgi:hypothetical protein
MTTLLVSVRVLKEIARTDGYKRLLLSGVHWHLYRLLYSPNTSNLHNFAMRFTTFVFVLAAGLAVIAREETTFLWMGWADFQVIWDLIHLIHQLPTPVQFHLKLTRQGQNVEDVTCLAANLRTLCGLSPTSCFNPYVFTVGLPSLRPTLTLHPNRGGCKGWLAY